MRIGLNLKKLDQRLWTVVIIDCINASNMNHVK